jgi:hypothetical protein
MRWNQPYVDHAIEVLYWLFVLMVAFFVGLAVIASLLDPLRPVLPMGRQPRAQHGSDSLLPPS